MKIMLVEEDNSTFETIESMLETLHRVSCDELEAQGHTPHCAGMLVMVINTIANLSGAVEELQDDMMNDLTPQLSFLGDDTDEG